MNEPRIAVLGTVEVTGTKRTTSLAGTNMPALLSMLALTPGRPVPNDRIIDALWPGTDPARAGRSLISLVHHLNVTLGAQLGIHKPVASLKSVGRVLRVDPETIDVVQFEMGLADADDHVAVGRLDDAVDAYEAALALWRGDPFGGIDLPCFVEPSARLRIARHRAETSLIDASLRVGRGASLVPWLQQRADADPFDEWVAADAARALYQAGRSGDALRVLRACMDEQRRRGVQVRSHIRQLEMDVLDHTLEGGGGESAGPPARLYDQTAGQLIGRHGEQTVLDDWFADPAGTTVMVITGEAGIGKTALVEWWLDGIGDGHVVVRARCTPDPAHPLEPFAPLLNDAAVQPDAQFDQVVTRIIDEGNSGVRLLVIDDAQWLTVAAVALVRHMVWHPDVHRLQVLLAIRSPDAATNAALAQILTDLDRAGRSSSMRLRSFDLADLDDLLGRYELSWGGQQIEADHLLRLTGGNPLLVAEVLRHTRSGADIDTAGVPAVAATLLGRYLEPLPKASRWIVEVAALLGDGDPSRLAAHAGVTELEVIDALDLVANGRLVHVDPMGGGYVFVHDLARRAVIEGIEPTPFG